MVYGLAADIHLHQWSAFASTDEEGLNTRLVGLLDEIYRACHALADVAGAGAQMVLAGDIFHVRGSVSPTVLNAVKDRLKHCHEQLKTEFIILAGNHDLEGKESTRLGSAVTALECEYVEVVNDPQFFHLGTCKHIVLVPWMENVEQLKAAIEALGTGKMDKFFRKNADLILHAPIDGVIDGLPDHGLSPEWLAALGFRRVFAGHYHNHREFPGGVYSIGALAHHTWSDVGTRAGFLLVSDDSVEWKKSHLPQFIDVERLVDINPAELPFMVEGNFVRAKVESGSAVKVAELREELVAMGAKGVLIQATVEPPKRVDAVTASVTAGASLEVSIGEYVARFGDKSKDVLTAALAVLSAADAVEVA